MDTRTPTSSPCSTVIAGTRRRNSPCRTSNGRCRAKAGADGARHSATRPGDEIRRAAIARVSRHQSERDERVEKATRTGCTAVIALLCRAIVGGGNAGDMIAPCTSRSRSKARWRSASTTTRRAARTRAHRSWYRRGELRLHDGVWRVGDAGRRHARRRDATPTAVKISEASPSATPTRIDVSTDDCVGLGWRRSLGCRHQRRGVGHDQRRPSKSPRSCAGRGSTLTRLGDNAVLVGFLRARARAKTSLGHARSNGIVEAPTRLEFETA